MERSKRGKKIETLGRMTAMTQEEIVAAVKTVAQGLEALRSEHAGILHGLHDAPDSIVSERAGFVQHSAEMIELGLGEAQVSNIYFI
nr:kinesin light chain-like isoform X2 [Leptinotarsa decemlineata]